MENLTGWISSNGSTGRKEISTQRKRHLEKARKQHQEKLANESTHERHQRLDKVNEQRKGKQKRESSLQCVNRLEQQRIEKAEARAAEKLMEHTAQQFRACRDHIQVQTAESINN